MMRNTKYSLILLVAIIGVFISCGDGTPSADQLNEAIETPKQMLEDTDATGETSPSDANIEAKDKTQLNESIVQEEAPGGTLGEPAPNSEQRLEQYYQRQGDENKIDPVTNQERAERNEGISYLYGYEDIDTIPSPTGKAGDYEITYYKNDASFYKDLTTATSSPNYKSGKKMDTAQPMKVVNGKKVPIQKMGDAGEEQ